LRSARDLWAHSDISFKDGMYTTVIPSHEVLMLRASATN
jgi:hypothetical protein